MPPEVIQALNEAQSASLVTTKAQPQSATTQAIKEDSE
jgi:hypothetical protein